MKLVENKKDILFYVGYCIGLCYIGYLCFYRLGVAGIQSWDEARHGINAYEMLKQGELWIHSYNYEVDYYNYKPPLSMWLIMMNYGVFGVGAFALRVGSAGAAVLLCLIVSLFLVKEYGRIAALLFLGFFSFCSEMIFFHMARSGDADAVYQLFFCAGMICLYYGEKKRRYWLFFLFSSCFSFAFLAKSIHAVLMLAIAFFYMVYKMLRGKRSSVRELFGGLGYVVGGFFPLAVWVIIRYRFDGFEFMKGMFQQEVVDRVLNENEYGGYIFYLLANKAVLFMIFLCVFLFVLYWVGKERERREWFALSEDTSLIVLWILVPLGVYSLSGAFLQWYGYTSLIAICVYFSILCGRLMLEIGYMEGMKYQKIRIGGVGLCLLVGLLYFAVGNQRWLLDLYYECNRDFREDIQAAMGRYPEYAGGKLYVENGRNEYKQQELWEQNLLLESQYAGDLQCVDGGVPIFLEDQEGLLIISKNLFEEFAGELAGRIVLVDGDDYLIFSNSFY